MFFKLSRTLPGRRRVPGPARAGCAPTPRGWPASGVAVATHVPHGLIGQPVARPS